MNIDSNIYFPGIEIYRKKKLKVDKNSSNYVSFMITPTKIGDVEIKATASSFNVQETVSKLLKVEVKRLVVFTNFLVDINRFFTG